LKIPLSDLEVDPLILIDSQNQSLSLCLQLLVTFLKQAKESRKVISDPRSPEIIAAEFAELVKLSSLTAR
jgi:hypothetical protein